MSMIAITIVMETKNRLQFRLVFPRKSAPLSKIFRSFASFLIPFLSPQERRSQFHHPIPLLLIRYPLATKRKCLIAHSDNPYATLLLVTNSCWPNPTNTPPFRCSNRPARDQVLPRSYCPGRRIFNLTLSTNSARVAASLKSSPLWYDFLEFILIVIKHGK